MTSKNKHNLAACLDKLESSAKAATWADEAFDDTDYEFIHFANPETILLLCQAVRVMQKTLIHIGLCEWKKCDECSRAIDGGYLGDHYIHEADEALATVNALFEESK